MTRSLLLTSLPKAAPTAVPLLPAYSLEGEDETFSLLITEMIEQSWKPDGFFPWSDPDQYRQIVEDLDRIPPAFRARVGRRMFETYSKMRAGERRRSFTFVDYTQSGIFLFVYDSSQRWPEPKEFLSMVLALAMTRFAQALESSRSTPRFALGAGVLVDDSRGVSYSFAHVETADGLEGDIRRLIEEDFGVFNGSTVVAPSQPR